jgi:hypothetical protein
VRSRRDLKIYQEDPIFLSFRQDDGCPCRQLNYEENWVKREQQVTARGFNTEIDRRRWRASKWISPYSVLLGQVW